MVWSLCCRKAQFQFRFIEAKVSTKRLADFGILGQTWNQATPVCDYLFALQSAQTNGSDGSNQARGASIRS
jgi:hypothetical protein